MCMSRAPAKAGVHFTLDVFVSLLLFRHATFIHDGHFSVCLSPVTDRHRPFFSCLECSQIKSFQQCLIAWKYAALAVQLTVSGIEAFDRVRRINDRSDICRKLEDWSNGIPVCAPGFHSSRIFLSPFFFDRIPDFRSSIGIRSMINFLKIRSKRLTIFICYIFQCISNLMHNAALVFCLWKGCRYRIFDPGKAISTDNHDVPNTAVFEAV